MSQLRSLDEVRIARPCPARWEEMAGDERVRFCTACRKNVYNLSAMTRDDATRLIQEREGDLCARLYRRQDGTVLTSDCPVGVRAFALRVVQKVAAAAALALLAFGGRFLTTHSRPEVRSVSPSQETPHAVPVKAHELTPEQREMLGSLGYIGG
jgi:DNA-binding NarL/FixJ family response regulator